MDKKRVVILFYKFVKINNPEDLRKKQKDLAESLNLTGRIILATEGINATLEGERGLIEKYKKELKKEKQFKDIVFKESGGTGISFPKLSVKVRDEIVALKAKSSDLSKDTANYVSAEELEEMYKNGEDFLVLDLRNNYEIACGKFDNTVDPDLEIFRELPEKVSAIEKYKDKKLVAVCTGGIRCEKATRLLRKKGFDNLYQLKDGIHTYMQEFPGSHFKGTLFVFDNRMKSDVVDVPQKTVIGTCIFCNEKTEDFYSDDSYRPSRKVLCCQDCVGSNGRNLRNVVS
jgi:UPF0176 protein